MMEILAHLILYYHISLRVHAFVNMLNSGRVAVKNLHLYVTLLMQKFERKI